MSEDEQRTNNLIIFGLYLTDEELQHSLKNGPGWLILFGVVIGCIVIGVILKTILG